MATERETREFQLTIDGETRTVLAKDVCGDGKRFDTCEFVALCKFRTGDKFWPTRIMFWRQADGSYKPNMTYTHLNRHTTTVRRWNDEVFADRVSQHNTRR